MNLSENELQLKNAIMIISCSAELILEKHGLDEELRIAADAIVHAITQTQDSEAMGMISKLSELMIRHPELALAKRTP